MTNVTSPFSLASVHELFTYNYWARDCQLKVCQRLTEEQLLRGLGSSFDSVRDTLVHMMETEWIWLERWRQHPPHAEGSSQPFPSVKTVSERWSAIEAEMRDYLARVTDEMLGKPLTYISDRGDTLSSELWRQMFHLINHQSYHRGQVATLLRQLGEQPPATDFLPGYRSGFRVS